MLPPTAAIHAPSLLQKAEKKDLIASQSTEPSGEGEKAEQSKLSSQQELELASTELTTGNNSSAMEDSSMDSSYLEDVKKIEAHFNLSWSVEGLTQEEMDFVNAVDGREGL